MENIDTPTTTGLIDRPAGPDYRLGAIPLAPERFSTWPERLAQWRALRDSPLYLEDGRAQAARGAERHAKRRLSVHHATQYGHVFSNKRIPRDVAAAAMGRFEADLIALTPRRVVVLEVKNWSGQLKVAGDRWVQVQRSGAEVTHPNLLAHNREKLRALHRYLAHAGVNIAAVRFHQAVIFANPRLEIDPSIADHPAVLCMDDVGDVLGGGTSLGRHVAARLVQLLTDAETNATLAENLLKVIAPAEVAAATAAIKGLRTWDRLTLRGGRELQGDIIWLRLTGNQAPAAALKPGGTASLEWRRGVIGGIQWVLRNRRAGTLRGDIFWDQHLVPGRQVPLDADDCVYFHEPGEPKPSIIALSHVERVQIG
jgi:hypothetical protein